MAGKSYLPLALSQHNKARMLAQPFISLFETRDVPRLAASPQPGTQPFGECWNVRFGSKGVIGMTGDE
jgi:hypothetical protein